MVSGSRDVSVDYSIEKNNVELNQQGRGVRVHIQ